jgi:6-phosphogluconolactonase
MGAVVCCRLALLRKALVVTTAVAAVCAAPAAAHNRGHDRDGDDGAKAKVRAVYTQTNDPAGNNVLVFTRNSDGTLTEPPKRVSTGGVGTASQPPFGFPIVDSQGSVLLTEHGRLLFVVNSGSNTVSSFRVTRSGDLQLADQKPSGGVLPISVTADHRLLYVLNEGGNISGLRYSKSGQMTPIPGSTRPLSFPSLSSLAAQIGFDPEGRVLSVTERCYFSGCPGHPKGIIDTFVVGHDGTPGTATLHDANDFGPFGFDFSGEHNMILANTGQVQDTPPQVNPGDFAFFTGTASSYRVSHSGDIAATDLKPTGGRGACWTVTTKDGRYAFITNSLSDVAPGSGKGGVTQFTVDRHGTLTLLGKTDVTPDPAGPAFPTDLTLSRDDRYLYVLVPTLTPGNNTSHIDVYRRSGGKLTHIQTTSDTLPAGVSGMAAR